MKQKDKNGQKRILIIEDEQYLRELYQEILEDEGFIIETASDGMDGYVKMAKGGYDLILLDVMLPRMDGLELLAKLRKGPKPKKTNGPIVLLTNLSKDMAISKGKTLGISGYLIKSDLTPGEIIEKVKGYLKIKI
ncbi:MAG: response regulator transcription factor [Patescibacteria group bacterium]|nr:response regulator transcription factor [Patescibacteria group bacterium]